MNLCALSFISLVIGEPDLPLAGESTAAIPAAAPCIIAFSKSKYSGFLPKFLYLSACFCLSSTSNSASSFRNFSAPLATSAGTDFDRLGVAFAFALAEALANAPTLDFSGDLRLVVAAPFGFGVMGSFDVSTRCWPSFGSPLVLSMILACNSRFRATDL